LGGAKKQLLMQFLTEALLLSICSAVLGIVLGRSTASFLQPAFWQRTGFFFCAVSATGMDDDRVGVRLLVCWRAVIPRWYYLVLNHWMF
jgi:hypothetical protein